MAHARLVPLLQQLEQVPRVINRSNIDAHQVWLDRLTALESEVQDLLVYAKKLRSLVKTQGLLDTAWNFFYRYGVLEYPEYLVTSARTWNYVECYVIISTYLPKNRPDWLPELMRLQSDSYYREGPLVQSHRITVSLIRHAEIATWDPHLQPLIHSIRWKPGQTRLIRIQCQVLFPAYQILWHLYQYFAHWPWCLLVLLISFEKAPPLPTGITASMFEAEASYSLYQMY